MSRIFKKPKYPTPPPAPAAVPYTPPSSGDTSDSATNTPTTEEIAAADPTGAINEDAEEAALASVNKKKKGRKSTILTGPQGLTTEAETYSPTLLG